MATVEGVVLYRGRPVEGAEVGFMAAGASRYATGKTDADGEFRLSTFEPNDGAIVGTHTVTVRKLSRVSNGARAAAGYEDVESAMRAEARRAQAERNVLPARYARRDTTDLQYEVKPGANRFEIAITD